MLPVLFIRKTYIRKTQKHTNELLRPVYDIDLSRISNKEIVSFIHDHKLYKLDDFASLKCFCKETQAAELFHHHVKTFHVNHPVNKVWEAYKTTPPKQAWCGSMLQFGLQYCRKQNKFSYIDDDFKEALVGQIIFIRVKVLGGLAKIAVGHEITAINNEETYMETSYLMKGKSIGSQRVYFEEDENGHTKITHHTIYKSNSAFRDKYLYPLLHTKAIKEFHHNIWKQLNKS